MATRPDWLNGSAIWQPHFSAAMGNHVKKMQLMAVLIDKVTQVLQRAAGDTIIHEGQDTPLHMYSQTVPRRAVCFVFRDEIFADVAKPVMDLLRQEFEVTFEQEARKYTVFLYA